MCFSAGASFAGGVILAGTGFATIQQTVRPSRMLFASIPFLFGLQQFSEGIIWLILRSGGNDVILKASTIFFLIMALLVWPVMMPLATLMIEPYRIRRKLLTFLLAAGIIVTLYYAYCMIFYDFYPVIEKHHIRYIGEWPRKLRDPVFALYAIATIPPLFISSLRRMWIMGVLILVSVIVSGIFFRVYLTSVWCFFAALISVVIYLILRVENRASTAG
ncbi:MAG TPA: hypothetical protein P5180_12840 [Bacteroidales bacterium]|nr:hypothetical protein [Bacteroidales bacterium]HRW86309.1 hypothetical protein [Bacteroidales bacterium]